VESGHYHVYVGNACPWCHRVLLVLALTGNRTRVSWVLPLVELGSWAVALSNFGTDAA